MRVHYVQKARAAKSPRKCRRCGHEVEVGEPYKHAEPRFGPRLFWCKDHTPKRSETSSSKLGPVWDAMDEFDPSGYESADELTSAVQSIADTAREIGEEYQEGIDNMPEGLQEGHVAEESREKVDALEAYADELEQWEAEEDELDEDADEDERDDHDALASAREEASDVVGNFDY